MAEPPPPRSPANFCALAAEIVRVGALPCRRNGRPCDFHQKNTMVLAHFLSKPPWGSIWPPCAQMAPPGCPQSTTRAVPDASYGCIWLYMVAYDCIWLHMITYGCIWLHMPGYGIWLHVAAHMAACMWLHIAAYGYIWLHMATYGCICLHIKTYIKIYKHILFGVSRWGQKLLVFVKYHRLT